MSRNRRSDVQILTDVLSVALVDVGVTHLMYKANLSYSTLRRYLSAAQDKGLINKVNNGDGTMVYRTTEKGRIILEKLKDVKTLLQS
jgi:predicted transcriptional regulator